MLFLQLNRDISPDSLSTSLKPLKIQASPLSASSPLSVASPATSVLGLDEPEFRSSFCRPLGSDGTPLPSAPQPHQHSQCVSSDRSANEPSHSASPFRSSSVSSSTSQDQEKGHSPVRVLLFLRCVSISLLSIMPFALDAFLLSGEMIPNPHPPLLAYPSPHHPKMTKVSSCLSLTRFCCASWFIFLIFAILFLRLDACFVLSLRISRCWRYRGSLCCIGTHSTSESTSTRMACVFKSSCV